MPRWLMGHGATAGFTTTRLTRFGVAGAVALGVLAPAWPAAAQALGAAAGAASRSKPHCPVAQFGAAVAIAGGTAVVGARSAPHGGAVCIFARSGRAWRLQAVLTDPPGGKFDGFGSVVAVSRTARGTIAMIGAEGVRDNSGSVQPDGPVYVYARSGGSWRRVQTIQDPLGYHPGNWFGGAIAMSGTGAVITALGTSNFKGAAYIYRLTGHSWRLRARLKNPGIDDFGSLTAMSGKTVVIGNGGQASPPGPTPTAHLRASAATVSPDAFVFIRSRTGWHLQAHLRARPGDNSEPAVAISGNTVMVGGIFVPGFGGSDKNADRGHVYVFKRTRGTWHRRGILSDPGHSRGDFSNGLAVAGAAAVIGAPGALKGCGVAYVYLWTGTKWAVRAKLVPPGAARCRNHGAFGWSAALSGKTTVIGAPGNGKTYVLNIP